MFLYLSFSRLLSSLGCIMFWEPGSKLISNKNKMSVYWGPSKVSYSMWDIGSYESSDILRLFIVICL